MVTSFKSDIEFAHIYVEEWRVYSGRSSLMYNIATMQYANSADPGIDSLCITSMKKSIETIIIITIISS